MLAFPLLRCTIIQLLDFPNVAIHPVACMVPHSGHKPANVPDEIPPRPHVHAHVPKDCVASEDRHRVHVVDVTHPRDFN